VSYGFGQILGVDPGSISYAVPLHRQWYKRSLAHNLIVVDQRDQRPTTGKLHFYQFGPNCALAHADAGDAYDGVTLTRTIAMFEDTFIVIDIARSATEHTYDWVYHNRGKLALGAKMTPSGGKLGGPDPYRVPHDVRSATLRQPFQAIWRVGDVVVPLTFFLDRGATVFTALAPGQPPTEMVPMLLVRQRGKSVAFLWAFRIVKGDPSPLTVEKLAITTTSRSCADREAVAVRVRGKGVDHLLAVNFTKQPVQFANCSLDGTAVLAVKDRETWRTLLGVNLKSFETH